MAAKTYLDVKYAGPTSDEFQKVDIFLPNASQAAPPPLLVFIHGGAWRDHKMQKAQHYAMARSLSSPSSDGSQGIAVALINYRLSLPGTNHVLHPDHINDANQALDFLLYPSPTQPWALAYNSSRVVVAGHSAGAHMTLSQALDPAHALTMGVGPKAAEIGAWNESMLKSGRKDDILPLMPTLTRGREKIKAWIGISGIYSIVSMLLLHPQYLGFIEGAFGVPASRATFPEEGTDYSRYQVVSSQAWPVAPGGYAKGAMGPTYYFLHSREDELLSYNESVTASQELQKQIQDLTGARVEIDLDSVRGSHNGCLQTPEYFDFLRKVIKAET